MTEASSLVDLVDRIRRNTGGEEVTTGEIVLALGERGILPAILLPALIAATPLSGIPGVSAVCGALIALLSFELIFRFEKLYLPRRLTATSIDGDRLRRTLDRIVPALAFIDRYSRRRLSFLFHRPLIWVPQVLCMVTGMMMPLLEFIPFSASIGAIGVSLLVMAMLTKDGIFFILALLPYAGGIYLATRVVG